MSTTGIDLVFGAETQEAGAKINEFLHGVQEQLAEIGKNFIAAFTIAAFAERINETIKLEEETGKLAQTVGTSTEKFSELAYWLKSGGVQTDEFTSGMRVFNERIAAGDPLFNQLGIAIKDAGDNQRDTGEIFLDFTDKMSHFEEGANKSTLAVNALGRSGALWIPIMNQGRDGFRNAAAEGQKFGVVVSDTAAKAAAEFRDNLGRLEQATQGLFNSIANELLPGLTALSDKMVEARKSGADYENVLIAVSGLFQTISYFATTTFTIVSATVTMLKGLGEIIATIKDEIVHSAETGIQRTELLTRSIGQIFAKTKLEVLESLIDYQKSLDAIYDPKGKDKPFEKAQPKTKAPQVSHLDTLKMASEQAAAQLAVWEAEREQELQSLDNLYAQELISTRDYTEQRSEIIRQAFSDQAAKISQEILDLNKKIFNPNTTADQRTQYLATQQKLNTDLEALRVKRDTALQKIDDDALAVQRKAAKDASDAYVQATENKLQQLEREYVESKRTLALKFSDEEEYQIALGQLEQTYAVKRAQTRQDMMARQRQLELADLQAQRERLDKNNSITPDAKQSIRQPLLQKEADTLRKSIADTELFLKQENISDEARIAARQELIRLNSQLIDTEKSLQQTSWGGTIRSQIQDWVASLGSTAQQVGSLITNTLSGAISGLSNALAGAIMGTQDLGQAMSQFAVNMATQFISSVLQMILMATVAIPILTALGILSSGSTIGPGLTMTTLALGMVPSLTAPFAAATGGLIPGGEQFIRINELGPEFVIPAHKVAEFGAPFFEGIRTGAIQARDLAPRIATPITSRSASQGGLPAGAMSHPAVHVNTPQPKVIVVNSQEELQRALEGSMGEKATIAHVRNNKLKLGIRS